MDECKDCEYIGYSPQLCMAHIRHCKKRPPEKRKPMPRPLKIGAKTIAGAGVGMATAVLASTAVSLVGGVAVIHAVFAKLCASAGLAGSGIGLFSGLKDKESSKQ